MTEQTYVAELIDQEDDFDRWYVEVVQKAELADDAPVRGCKVIRPYGFGIWERCVIHLDARIKATGVENAYFPLFIPRGMLAQEAEHVEGFAPEVAWVTRGGERELEEPWAVRPTSEAIICPSYARWVQSYRDLPILINQWGNAVRWEERPRAFLRTLEFLWQEGHTCHASGEEADARARQMLEVYRAFLEEDLAIPVVPGVKTESEKFAGALRTHTVEAMMGGKFWALQAGTSHDLGDHFARVFGIRFLDRDGERKLAYSTSFGLSHRVVGATVMVHGDDAGLKLPPRVAPVQAVVIPIWRGETEKETVTRAVGRVEERLAPVARLRVDWREERTPGFKFNEWELKGAPLRLEVGPRDVAADQVTIVRRDTHRRCGELRRTEGAGGRQCRLVARALVRRCGLRGAGESGDEGDHPLHPARPTAGARPLPALRRRQRAARDLRPGILIAADRLRCHAEQSEASRLHGAHIRGVPRFSATAQ
jgi:prolyl-tRNA synthetase